MKLLNESVVTIASSVISSLGIYFGVISALSTGKSTLEYWPPQTQWQFAILFFIFVAWLPSAYEVLKGPRTMAPHEADKRMLKLIKSKRKLTIHTQNLSWIDANAINAIVGSIPTNIEFFLPEEVPAAQQLRGAGCRVHIYKGIYQQLETRFTIVDPDESHSYVILAHMDERGRVMLRNYRYGESPVWSLMSDLRKAFENGARVSSSP